MRSGDRVVVGWCDPGTVAGAFACDVATLARSRDERLGPLLRVQGSGLLSRIRNELVKTFLDSTDAAWLWMVDTDQRVPVAVFDALVAAVHDKTVPVLAGVVFAAYPDPSGGWPVVVPAIYRLDPDGVGHTPIFDYLPGIRMRVDAAGTGCLMVHRTVLETIRATADPGLRDWCWFADGPTGDGRWLSEDLTFCRRVRDAGFPIHAHTGAVLPHRKTVWVDEHTPRPRLTERASA